MWLWRMRSPTIDLQAWELGKPVAWLSLSVRPRTKEAGGVTQVKAEGLRTRGHHCCMPWSPKAAEPEVFMSKGRRKQVSQLQERERKFTFHLPLVLLGPSAD